MCTKSHISYCSVAYRCLLTPSSGSEEFTFRRCLLKMVSVDTDTRQISNYVWFSTHIVVHNCLLINSELAVWFRKYVAVACRPVANFLRRGTRVVQLCSGVSPCGSDAKKWRIFKKFGKEKFVNAYILRISKILYDTALCFSFSFNRRRIMWSSFHLLLGHSRCFFVLGT
jgi:hypothetical protein